MTQLKDVIHFYLGCKVVFDNKTWEIIGVHKGIARLQRSESENKNTYRNECYAHELKLVLRKIDSMTKEEFEAIMLDLSGDIFAAYNAYITWKNRPKHVLILMNRLHTNTLTFNDGLQLIKRGYDLFGLIDSGQAING